MAFVVVADRAPHDGHVRLGFGVVVGRQRVLYPYVEPGAEHPPQAVGDEVCADRVADSLRRHGVQVSVDELQLGVRLERAGFHGTVVLDPSQAVGADGDAGHCGSHDGASIVARIPAPCGPARIRPGSVLQARFGGGRPVPRTPGTVRRPLPDIDFQLPVAPLTSDSASRQPTRHHCPSSIEAPSAAPRRKSVNDWCRTPSRSAGWCGSPRTEPRRGCGDGGPRRG